MTILQGVGCMTGLLAEFFLTNLKLYDESGKIDALLRFRNSLDLSLIRGRAPAVNLSDRGMVGTRHNE